MIRPHPALALAAALTFTLAACGADPDDDTPTPESTAGTDDTDADDSTGSADPGTGAATDDPGTTGATEDDAATHGAQPLDSFPVTVDTPLGEVTVPERPERIVSLSPAGTEILFAIGAGDQVVAADEWSTYPEEAPTTDLSGYEPNIEAIVSYEPDLVVISNDSNDLVASLEALDIPVLLNPSPVTVEEGWDEMAALGLATGHADETAEQIATLRQQVQDAFDEAPDGAQIRVYHELDETFFSASSHSFIGDVYTQLGAVNIADDADTEQTGYPQLTEEAVVEANPQLIVITDDLSYDVEDVAARPGWSEIDAVKNDNIIAVDADIASRWGPRLPQLVELLAGAMSEAAVPTGR